MKRLKIALVCSLLWATPALAQNQVTPTHTAISVGTSSTAAITSSAIIRKLLILQNDSDTVIYCNLAGAAAVANQGIRLNANGGSLFMDVTVSKPIVNCIHNGSGSKTLLVTED